MRIWSGAVILALGIGVSCASKSDSAATPPASGGAQAGGGAQTGAQAGGGAGQQAAARLTPMDLEAAMKGIQQNNGGMQKMVKANMLPEAAKNAQELARLFGEVERFFTQNNKPDAVKLAQEGRTGATGVAGAAAAGDQMKAAMAAANVGGTCKQCHGLYREGDAQTGFRIKAGTITP